MPPPEQGSGLTTAARAGRRPPRVPGILTAAQLAATGRAIAAMQAADGSVGWPDGHVDAWNHVECAMALSVCGLRAAARRAYGWLAAAQRPDGSWPVQQPGGDAAGRAAESNHAAYCAVGVWHEYLITGDTGFAERMWPVVAAGLNFAAGLQAPRGEIIWRRRADGSPDSYALLAGCSSMHQSLRCGIALARALGGEQPGWERAAALAGHAVARHGEAFADKSRFSMDWYYPVLGGAVRGGAAQRLIKSGWDTFVVPGLGVRCVSDEPWVTAAETCELALALDAAGQRDAALELLARIQFLRDGDGAYWTGWQYRHRRHYPCERSSYTAAAVVLAADALAPASGQSPAAGLFRAAGSGPGTWAAPDPAACGCAAAPGQTGPDRPDRG